jgi:hypothetical protein
MPDPAFLTAAFAHRLPAFSPVGNDRKPLFSCSAVPPGVKWMPG